MTSPKKPEKSLVKTATETRRSLGRPRADVSLPVLPPIAEMPTNYGALLKDLKRRITSERLRVTLAANAAMVLLYWDIGQSILERQRREGWGCQNH